MDKTFKHQDYEKKISKVWEKLPKGKGKDYTILMPPPNANASLHAGHAMYTVDDILIRFKRMQGFSPHWIPGLDHAGFETQYVYEKHLAKDGRSRFDFDRMTLYSNIHKFVADNSGLIYDQFKRLGFVADWDKSVFTLDESVIKTVYETFKRMHDEGLIYRDNYIVNYCTKDGTSLAELEVMYIDRKDKLYYVRYKLADSDDFITVATVRPEPIFVDTHIAVNPKDKKHKDLIGKFAINPLTSARMEIIADEFVDPEFGTGIVKLTPAHDPNDFKVAKEHSLPIKPALDTRGKIINSQDLGLDGMNVRDAREKVVAILTERSAIEKIDENYEHSIATCYKCGRDIEPMVIPNWFIKVEALKKPVIEAVKKDKVHFTPRRFKKQILQWLSVMHDWPISRQIVWGIRIPVWYEITMQNGMAVSFIDSNGKREHGNLDELLKTFSLEEIKKGLQSLTASPNAKYVVSEESPGVNYLPETDTFDTWFSSGQWPIVTNPPTYPTDFMGTYQDILKFWVSRMILFGIYLRDDVPFREVYLWAGVTDSKGQKMSKSKGNVVNPLDFVEKYGADALRMSLMFGNAAGGKIPLSEDKVRSMRNFANKVWNVARFVTLDETKSQTSKLKSQTKSEDDEWILNELSETTKAVTENLERFQFNLASEAIYEFVWHKFADVYIEKVKDRRLEAQPTLEKVLSDSIKLLHPFMPFVTEAIWQENKKLFDGPSVLTSEWPH